MFDQESTDSMTNFLKLQESLQLSFRFLTSMVFHLAYQIKPQQSLGVLPDISFLLVTFEDNKHKAPVTCLETLTIL